MNRDFYFFGILFLGLYVVAALFQSILFFQIGTQLYYVNFFAGWMFVSIGTSLVGSAFMLNYFYHKGYHFSFITGIISVIARLCLHILFCLLAILLLRELQRFYAGAVIFSLGTTLLFSMGLIFSKSGTNPWLRTMGVFSLIVACLSVYLVILSLHAGTARPDSTVMQLSQWITLAGSLEPVPLIMLFFAERKASKSDPQYSSPYRFSEILTALTGIAFLMILVTGFMTGIQSYWKTHMSPTTKVLAEVFEARSYTNREGDTLLYRLLKPLDYNPDKQYPMVVCLHGGAGVGTDNYKQLEGSLLVTMLSKPENRKKHPAFLFVPQCPPGSSWGGLPNLPAIDTLVFKTMSALNDEFAIDEDRLYVEGHSMGAYGVWYFMGTHPGKFAAAIPMAGEGDPDLARNMLDVAVWAFHGANDRNVPVTGSREMIEAIRKAGGNPRYTESPNAGHSWKFVEDTPGVLEWLFAQKRD